MSDGGEAYFSKNIHATSAFLTTTNNDPQLTLISTDADANVGPVLKLYRNSASPADNDVLGKVQFSGKDDEGNENTYALIQTTATDVSNGSENAKMEFYVAINDTFNPSLTLEDTGAATFGGTITASSGATVGSLSLGDNQYIFLGDGNDGRIHFDGTDTLNITASHGTATTLNITANNFTIGGASALISGTANDKVVINEAGADVDFRVESDGNANMLFVDGGNTIGS